MLRLKVAFDAGFRIVGCEIVNYLLEKSRVVVQSKNERAYHIFYQMLAGADPELRQALGLLPADQYRYLRESGCVSIPGVDDAQVRVRVRLGLGLVLKTSPESTMRRCAAYGFYKYTPTHTP